MFCRKCGSVVPDDGKFCRRCGAALNISDDVIRDETPERDKHRTMAADEDYVPPRARSGKDVRASWRGGAERVPRAHGQTVSAEEEFFAPGDGFSDGDGSRARTMSAEEFIPPKSGNGREPAMPSQCGKPRRADQELPLTKIIAGVLATIFMLAGSIGLVIDFNAAGKDLASMYQAYKDVLRENKQGIETLANENLKNKEIPNTVAFADIVGDGKKELIFLRCESSPGSEQLMIYTYSDGELKKIYADHMYVYAGQGLQPYLLFTEKRDKSLWLYRQMRDDSELTTYVRFEADGDLMLTEKEVCKRVVVNENENASGKPNEYYKDGESCDEAAFHKAEEKYRSKIDKVLLCVTNFSDEAYKGIASAHSPAGYVYDEAVTYLEGKINGTEEQSDEETSDGSPFTLWRILFGVLAIAGLIGATVSFAMVIVTRQCAVTVIAVVLYALVAIGSVGCVTYSAVQNEIFKFGSSSGEEVPACEGLSLAEARAKLENEGYSVKTEYRSSDSVPADHVISQRVEDGADDPAVVLVISQGAATASENSGGAANTSGASKAETAPDGYAQKLLVTADSGSSYASAVLYEWTDGKWEMLAGYEATVGVNGIGNTSEGQKMTPQGLHKLGVVLTAESVDTRMRTYAVTSDTCVIDDVNSPYYNCIMSKSSIPSGTHYDNIGNGLTNGTTCATIFIEHNGDGFSQTGVVPGNGSAIGVRGQYGDLAPNYGDVDISASDMRDLLSRLDPDKNPMIEIKTN